MRLLLVYSYFLLFSRCCLEAVDPGMNDKVNELFENYMQLDLKFRAVSNENDMMKKRLDDLELVTDQVKELSEENIQLKHRVINLENLEHQVEKVLLENALLRQKVSRLGDKVKESKHEKTFGTNTIEIPNQKTTDVENINKGNRSGRDIENSLFGHPSMEQQLHPDMKQKAQYTEKGFREERDTENLIPDHPDFEKHIQNNVEYFRKTEKGFPEDRYMENLIPGHFEQYKENKVANFRQTEIEFRKERDIENAMPDHLVFEQYLPNTVPNFRKTENPFRGERYIENAMPDHSEFEQNTQIKAVDASNTNIFERASTGDRDITKKRLLIAAGQQPTPSLTTKVAFSVSLSTEFTLGQHQIIEYDHVYTNIGNGYDTRHGHFIAPSKAVYLFSCSIMNVEGKGVYIEIVKNGSRIAYMFADENDYNFANQVVMIALDKGDMVWVRNALGTGQKLIGDGYNSFSGTILFEID